MKQSSPDFYDKFMNLYSDKSAKKNKCSFCGKNLPCIQEIGNHPTYILEPSDRPLSKAYEKLLKPEPQSEKKGDSMKKKCNHDWKDEENIDYQDYDIINPICACKGILGNAIKHTKKYCYTENAAIKVERLNETKP